MKSSVRFRARYSSRRVSPFVTTVTGCAAALVVFMLSASPALAQNDDPAQLLEDFVFYTNTINLELAAANGQALLDLGLSDAELAVLVDESTKITLKRLEDAFLKGLRIAELEDIAAELAHRIERGRLDLARDPDRIKQAIEDLTGTHRGRLLARKRLVTAGEYAVPLLLLAITDGNDERLKTRCRDVLEEIGRAAVTPLCAALLELGDPQSQRLVCDVLGTIGWPHATPTLRELEADDSAPSPVREAAGRAARRLPPMDGVTDPDDLSSLYSGLARQYFNEAESLISYPTEPTNNVWSYDPIVGLTGAPVPTEIFAEIMAMKNASRAVRRFDATNREAIAIFVAANLKRENDLPAGQSDPIYGNLERTPDFYATVFGTQTCMDVLAMAIDAVDTPLVRDAIGALSLTTGGANLFDGEGGRQPLLEALEYPDRRAQYDAALTLGRALPDRSFAGDFTVVALLASAVRTGNRAFALVVADDEEDRRTIANMLETQDFEVIGQAPRLEELTAAIADAPGIDLVVVQKTSPDASIDVVSGLRSDPKTAASPALVRVGMLDTTRLNDEYRADRRVQVGVIGGGEPDFQNQVGALLEKAAGGRMTEAEAEAYAIEAMSALRDIAISRSPAFDINEAEPALVDALDLRSGGTRFMVADILALIDSDRAQRKLFDAALAESGQSQVELLYRVADSVRHFGDRAETRHLSALLALVKDASGTTAEAAAQVMGCMNLSGNEAVELIRER